MPSSIASNRGNVMLSGIIRTEDGKLVPKQIEGVSYSRSDKHSISSSFDVKTPEFSTKVSAGEIRLGFKAKGYAPAIVGPFAVKVGEPIAGIQVILNKGFPVRVHVVDEKGEPVVGATVGGNIDNVLGPGNQVTDAKGTAVFPHAAAGKYVFSVNRAGFEPFYSSTPMRIKQNDASATLTITRTRPVRGLVRFADGQPVVGAEVREFYSVAQQMSWSYTATQGNVLATTDADGRFVLDQLYNNRRYCLLVVAKDHRRQLIDDVSVNSPELHVTLGPELTVTGQIKGDIGKLGKEVGKPVVCCEQRARLKVTGGEDVSIGSVGAIVEPTEDGGRFVAHSLLPGLVSVSAGQHIVRTEVDAEHPHAHVMIDLTKPPDSPAKRQVILRLTTPSGPVSPEGKVCIDIGSLGEWRQQKHKELPVTDGEVFFKAFAPGWITYSSRALVGYWFKEGLSVHVEPGDEPFVIEVPVVAAGAIAGQVLNSDGTPVTGNISVSVHGKLKTAESTTEGGFGNVTIDRNKFFISPLPLAGSYSVRASVGHNIQIVGPIQLDDAHPTLNVSVQLPRTVSASGTVVDPAKKPLSNFPFSVYISDPRRNLNSGWGGNSQTDLHGNFRIDDLSAGIGEYSLVFSPRSYYCPNRFPLSRNGKLMTIMLKRGLVLEGQVLDEATGWPIPGVEVYAMPQPLGATASMCEAEGPTDREGRFRFSNLEDRQYQFNAREAASLKIPDAERIRRPGNEPLVLRITLPKWSKLQPRPPN